MILKYYHQYEFESIDDFDGFENRNSTVMNIIIFDVWVLPQFLKTSVRYDVSRTDLSVR